MNDKANNDYMKNVHCISHNAMATGFSFRVEHEDKNYVQSVVREAITELDRIEGLISRFKASSDISAINRAKKFKEVFVSPETFECLEIAQKVYKCSSGLFDITIAPLYKCLINKDRSLRKPGLDEIKAAKKITGMNLLELDKDNVSVIKRVDGVAVDLGGIGKGYVLDEIAKLFGEMDIKRALLYGGKSTILAMVAPSLRTGWPTVCSDPANSGKLLIRMEIENEALSCSGLQRGQHIINPLTASVITTSRLSSWSMSETAAMSDALSTMFMLMDDSKAAAFCSKHSDIVTGCMLADFDEDSKVAKSRVFRAGCFKLDR